MSQSNIVDLFKTQTRFMRSAHLERDFRDPTALEGYIVTPAVQHNLNRLGSGLGSRSGQRAWRITGDYGSGKSSFALLLAHAFSGREHQLPPPLRRSIDLTVVKEARPKLLPVLITGSREPLALALLRGLSKALGDNFDDRPRLRCLGEIKLALGKADPGVTDEEILALIQDTNAELITKNHATGLLIIIDELGKFLEYSALHPERGDIFILQQLAEASARSGKEPLFTVGLLHQGFNAYADQLSQSAQREWEKVAGRFEEVIFDQPLEQITYLVGAALNVDHHLLPRGWASKSTDAMRAAINFGWFGSAPPVSSLTLAARATYPLHPTVIPVLVKLFRRFAQNERSLFSFLLSGEPFGLQAFSNTAATADSLYRLHHLYDYASANFGHRLSSQSYRSHWNHIESLVQSFHSSNDGELAVLKTIGLLNLINSPDLVPTEDALVLAIADTGAEAETSARIAIQQLHKERHVIYHRGSAGGYCLWSHTSVNLDAAYEEAGRAVSMASRVTSLVKEMVNCRPIVARRHYIQTGNLRHFEVIYCTLFELHSTASATSDRADGRIIIPLCETNEEVRAATAYAREFADRPDTVIGISQPLGSLGGLIYEVERWTWIQKNTPELKDDRHAAEEVARQLYGATQTLEKRVQHYVGLRQSSATVMAVRWFYNGAETVTVKSPSDFLSFLSVLCDALYDKAPVVHNELINRRVLSSAAAAARMRLIERLLTSSERELLGMDAEKKPPEMSMYLSLLAQSTIHRFQGDGWIVAEPKMDNDPCRLKPALTYVQALLEAKADARINVEVIFEALRKPPFGIRDGLLPVLLVVTLTEHQQEVALYENGTFLSFVGAEEILRLSKRPATFEVQMFRLKGVRLTVFEDLLGVLRLESKAGSKAHLLDIVRPLCVFVAELPQYARTTRKLTDTTLRVRDAILAAREPSTLLFRELPDACGLEAFLPGSQSDMEDAKARQFAAALKASLEELRLASTSLNDRIRKLISAGFEGKQGFDQAFRNSLADRAESLMVGLRDIDLKAFCLRLMDNNLPEPDWLESVGSFVALTPPSRWKDEDEDIFKERLDAIVQKFLRVESVVFASGRIQSTSSLFRIAVTARDGQEREQVVHLDHEEEREGKALEKRVSKLLASNPRVSSYALSRLIWKLLDNTHAPN